MFLFIRKHPKNLLGLHIQKKYSFECETRQLQQVSSGLNRMFISIISSYLYQIKHIRNNAVIISFFICICTGRCCSWCSSGPSDQFWLGELYFLFALYSFGNYCGTKVWEPTKKQQKCPWDDSMCLALIHLPRWQHLLAHWQQLMKNWTPGCLTNRPGNKQIIRSGFELWFARSDFKLYVVSQMQSGGVSCNSRTVVRLWFVH